MAFEEIRVMAGPAAARSGCSASLLKMRGAPAKLIIQMRESAMEEMGFLAGDRFVALLGTAEDHGLIRLRKDASGSCVLTRREGPRGSAWWNVSLGHLPAFVDRPQKTTDCRWERIDDLTMEIVLPDWADETRPRPAKAISATPPAIGAARREDARLRREAEEVDARRAAREAAEHSEAFADLTRRLDAAQTASFHPRLRLTKSEKALLTILSDRAGRVVSKESLMLLLYGDAPDEPPDEKVIDVYVCKIRPKLAGTGCSIETVWGEGFRFTGDDRALRGAEAR